MAPPRGDRRRRRAVLASCGAVAVALSWPATAEASAPRTVCTVQDERLAELSGLASNGQELFAVNDGGTQVEVFVLDRNCRVQRTITAGIDPYDVEDLALAPDGVLWLSDTGDNGKSRDTVAVIKVRQDGSASLHRMTYPDGQHDTEAIVLDRRGVPHLITKNVLGTSEIYRPTGKLRSPGPTPLEKVGTVGFGVSNTPGGPEEVGVVGSILVTGGAVSHDGKVVALRTYTDAYLYQAPDGDVVAALGREPVRIPLPNEPQGEAIAFDPDGTLLSASEGVGEPIRAVPKAVEKVASVTPGDAGKAASDARDGRTERTDEQQRSKLPALAVAAIAVAVLWFGLGRLRRRRR